jgi:hypothetical protein
MEAKPLERGIGTWRIGVKRKEFFVKGQIWRSNEWAGRLPASFAEEGRS